MLELRFDRFAAAATSPMALSFAADPPPPLPAPLSLPVRLGNRVVISAVRPQALRFGEAYSARVSPVTLEYGKDVFAGIPASLRALVKLDTSITAIIIDRSVGIEIGFGWAGLTAAEQAILLASQSDAVDMTVSVSHSGFAPLDASVWLQSYASELLDMQIELPHVLGSILQHVTIAGWVFADDHLMIATVAWTLPNATQELKAAAWFNRHGTESHMDITWCDGYGLGVYPTIRYRALTVVDTEQTLAWGYRAPKWICSTKYRPPSGKITMTFDVTTVAAAIEHHLPADVSAYNRRLH